MRNLLCIGGPLDGLVRGCPDKLRNGDRVRCMPEPHSTAGRFPSAEEMVVPVSVTIPVYTLCTIEFRKPYSAASEEQAAFLYDPHELSGPQEALIQLMQHYQKTHQRDQPR